MLRFIYYCMALLAVCLTLAISPSVCADSEIYWYTFQSVFKYGDPHP